MREIYTTEEESLYLENLLAFFRKLPAHQINQEVGFITAQDIRYGSPCGCFGVWCDVFYARERNKNWLTYRFEDGEEHFYREVGEDVLDAMREFAGVEYIFSGEAWKHHPKDVLKQVLDCISQTPDIKS